MLSQVLIQNGSVYRVDCVPKRSTAVSVPPCAIVFGDGFDAVKSEGLSVKLLCFALAVET